MKTRIVKGIVLFLVGVGLLIPNPAHARRMKIANYKDARPISDLSVEYLLRTLELEGFSCIAFVRNVLSIAEAVKCESYDIYNAMNIKMVGDFISSPFSETVLSEKDWGSVLSLLTDVKGFDKTREYPYELYKAQIDKREDFFLSEREKINFLDFLQGEAIGGAFDYAGLIQAPREEREMVKGVENDVEQSEWILLSDIIGEHNARLVIYKLKNSAEVNITQALPLVRQLSEKSFLKLNDKVSLRYRTYLLTDTRYFVDIIDELIYQSETSKIDFCSTVEEINRYLDVYSGIRLIHGRQRFNAGKAVILPCLQKFKANPQDISEAIRFIGSICNDLSNRNTKDFPSYDFFISSFIDYVVPQAIKNCADLVDLKVKLERTKNLFNLFADSGCYDFAFGFSEFGKFDSMGEILFAKNTDDFNKYVDIIEKTFIAVGELFPVRESDAPINKYTQSILPYLICKFLEPVLFQQAIDSFINCITRLNKEIPGQSGVMFNLFFEKFMPRLLNMPIESSEFSSFLDKITDSIVKFHMRGWNIDEIFSGLEECIDAGGVTGAQGALSLMEHNIYPDVSLVANLISKGEEDAISGYESIMKELQSRDPDLDNPIEVAIYFTVMLQRSHRFSGMNYHHYQMMLRDVQKFLEEHPEFRDIYSMQGYPSFQIRGNIIIPSEEFALQLQKIGKDLMDTYTKENADILATKGLKYDTQLYNKFLQRVLAYITIRDSKGPDFRIQGKNLSSFCNGEYQNTDSEILRLIREGTNSELEEKILAVVNNDYAKLVEARFVVSFYLFTSEPEHRDVLENEMLASVVTFGLVDDMIRNALITGNTQDRLTALEGVFNNLQLQHLVVDRAQLDLNQIPEQLKNDLRNMQRRFLEQAEEGKQTEQGLLSFIPMTLIEAVFRGYIGMDCSKDYYNGYPYVWTVHPNNKYYRIRKNGEDLGYIGLSEGKVEGTDGGRVLAIDTIQMHTQDRELIDNIIRQLEQVALQNGFWGIVIPKDLSMSFNSEITQGAIKDNVYFKSVVNVKVTYLDEGKTQTLIKYRGKDEYHSMMYGDFVYLPLHKENKVFMSDGIRGEVTEFIDRLSMEQEVGGFKEIWEYNE